MICIGYKGICRRLSGNDPRSSKPSWQCTLDRHCPGVILLKAKRQRRYEESGADNYIKVDENGHIHLTGSGLEIANKIYERHTFLTGWLTSIGVDADIAVEDACRIEHVISGQSFEAIKKYIAER